MFVLLEYTVFILLHCNIINTSCTVTIKSNFVYVGELILTLIITDSFKTSVINILFICKSVRNTCM